MGVYRIDDGGLIVYIDALHELDAQYTARNVWVVEGEAVEVSAREVELSRACGGVVTGARFPVHVLALSAHDPKKGRVNAGSIIVWAGKGWMLREVWRGARPGPKPHLLHKYQGYAIQKPLYDKYLLSHRLEGTLFKELDTGELLMAPSDRWIDAGQWVDLGHGRQRVLPVDCMAAMTPEELIPVTA